MSGAKCPLARLQPAIGAFWKSYASGMNLDKQVSQTMLARSVRCGAARMIQSAYEMMHRQQQMSPFGVAMLQTSVNILNRPSDAIAELLGIAGD